MKSLIPKKQSQKVIYSDDKASVNSISLSCIDKTIQISSPARAKLQRKREILDQEVSTDKRGKESFSGNGDGLI
jgi:hypothetical protein